MGLELGISPLSERAELRFGKSHLTGGLWRGRSEGGTVQILLDDKKKEEQIDGREGETKKCSQKSVLKIKKE